MDHRNISSIENAWRDRGFTGGIWVDPPGQCWENYVHETDELLMVIEGKIQLVVGERVFEPAVGEEVFIPAQVRHSVRNIGPNTATWLYAYRDE